jgi:chemotaxis signal transduction protein
MPEAFPSARDAKTVLFMLGDHRCMISADRVVRIDGARPITRVPLLPPEVAGIVVLGGKVIPVLALRSMLDLPAQAAGELVVVSSGGGNYVLLVDRVLLIGASTAEQQETLFIDVDALLGRILSSELAVGMPLSSADITESTPSAPKALLEDRALAVETETSRELLPLEAVVELSETLPVVAIPDPILAGAVLHRDRLVPLISLDALLGRPASNGASFVVVEVEGRRCALAVKAVIGLSAETADTVDLRSLLTNLLPAAAPVAPETQRQTPANAASLRYLLVELTGRTCAFALSSVTRIYAGCRVLKASAGHAVVGVTSVGGRVLPVLDLARLLGIDAVPGMQHFVELKSSTETFVVGVDHIAGVVSIGQDILVRQAEGGAIAAVAQLDGKLVWILAASLLAERAGARRDAA